jgi:hypothetical protein
MLIEHLLIPMPHATPHYRLTRTDLGNGSYSFQFAVIGRGIFAADMLRHDTCFPTDSVSAGNIMCGGISEPALRRVHLMCRSSNRNWQPTFDRWRSFGWVVETTAWEGREVA